MCLLVWLIQWPMYLFSHFVVFHFLFLTTRLHFTRFPINAWSLLDFTTVMSSHGVYTELHRVLGDQLDKVLEDYDADKCHHFLSAEALAEPQTAAANVTKAETTAVSVCVCMFVCVCVCVFVCVCVCMCMFMYTF